MARQQLGPGPSLPNDALRLTDMPKLYAENPSSPTTPTATGANAVAIGSNATAAGSHATAVGENSSATPAYSIALGGHAETVGEVALGGSGVTAPGQIRTAVVTLCAQTTNATELELGTNTAGASTTPNSYIVQAANSTCFYDVRLVGRRMDATGSHFVAQYTFAIAKDSTNASTVLLGSVHSVIFTSLGTATAWAVSIKADTTNGRPAIKVTGAPVQTIDWGATILATKCS